MWCKFGLEESERPTCKSEATTFSRSQTSCTSWKQRQAHPFHLNNSRRISSSHVTHACWWYHRLMASSVQVAVDLRMLVPITSQALIGGTLPIYVQTEIKSSSMPISPTCGHCRVVMSADSNETYNTRRNDKMAACSMAHMQFESTFKLFDREELGLGLTFWHVHLPRSYVWFSRPWINFDDCIVKRYKNWMWHPRRVFMHH